MRDGTDCAHLLRAYVRAWPAWLGGEGDAKRNGFKYHTQSQRSGDLGSKHGFPCDSRPRESATGTWGYHEYRFADRATYERARLQVKSWDTGIAVSVLEIQESLRPVYQAGLFTGGGV